jgi:hypothetical protein
MDLVSNVRDELWGTYSGRVVQVEVSFLQRLAVIALWIRQSEQPLLQKVAGPLLDLQSQPKMV